MKNSFCLSQNPSEWDHRRELSVAKCPTTRSATRPVSFIITFSNKRIAYPYYPFRRQHPCCDGDFHNRCLLNVWNWDQVDWKRKQWPCIVVRLHTPLKVITFIYKNYYLLSPPRLQTYFCYRNSNSWLKLNIKINSYPSGYGISF